MHYRPESLKTFKRSAQEDIEGRQWPEQDMLAGPSDPDHRRAGRQD